MQVIDSAGRLLNANYSIEPAPPCVDLIMYSRSGRSGASSGRNADYNPALTLLLERLGVLKATLLDAWVDSGRTRELEIPESKRKIIDSPVDLGAIDDMNSLRILMGRAQAEIAQASGAEKGGNRTKRIRIRLDVPGYASDEARDLADFLALPAAAVGPLNALTGELASTRGAGPRSEGDASLLTELDGDLDRLIQARQRREQSLLRASLFGSRAEAECDMCGREFPVGLLVAAHIKQRSQCESHERLDLVNIVMAACRFGCDELFERGYVTVGADGTVLLSESVRFADQVMAYVHQHLVGKVFRRSMSGRESYFAWHRTNRFRITTPDTDTG